MGYYTMHVLSIDPHDDDEHEKHSKAISEAAGYDEGLFESTAKWYECNDDMLEYSLQFPDVTFIIDGDGEENGDIWRSWFKNGKMQKWGLTFSRPEEPPLTWDKVE